jgi:hypothetical protein
MNPARIAAGIPETNSTLYWRIGFCVGDPVALIELPVSGETESTLILRDIEMGRARRIARVDRVAGPAPTSPLPIARSLTVPVMASGLTFTSRPSWMLAAPNC